MKFEGSISITTGLHGSEGIVKCTFWVGSIAEGRSEFAHFITALRKVYKRNLRQPGYAVSTNS